MDVRELRKMNRKYLKSLLFYNNIIPMVIIYAWDSLSFSYFNAFGVGKIDVY